MSNPFAPRKIKAITKPAPVEIAAPEQVEEAPFEGSVKETLDWVGGDKERAETALEAEEAKEEPRKSLVKSLKEIIAE